MTIPAGFMQPTTGFNLFFDKGDIEITYFVVLERIPDVTYLLHLVSLPRAAALPSGKGGSYCLEHTTIREKCSLECQSRQ